MGLAERKEAEAVVEIAAGENDASDRRVTRTARVKRREALDLWADLGRGVEQDPALTVGADGNAFLGSRLRVDRRCARPAAVRAAAIPLREAPSRGRAEHANSHRAPC